MRLGVGRYWQLRVWCTEPTSVWKRRQRRTVPGIAVSSGELSTSPIADT